MATIGGEACHDDPDSELAAALLALNAVFLVVAPAGAPGEPGPPLPAEPRHRPRRGRHPPRGAHPRRPPRRGARAGGDPAVPAPPRGGGGHHHVLGREARPGAARRHRPRHAARAGDRGGGPARADGGRGRRAGARGRPRSAATPPSATDAWATAEERRRIARPLARRALRPGARARPAAGGPGAAAPPRPLLPHRAPAPMPYFTSGRLELTVNGRVVRAEAEARTTLLDLLRGAGVYGVKSGCGTGRCGACTVLLDGRPVASCLTLAVRAQGRAVLTVEGLGTADRPHPLQDAFAETGASQCGFCTPGLVLGARALLDAQPHPTEERGPRRAGRALPMHGLRPAGGGRARRRRVSPPGTTGEPAAGHRPDGVRRRRRAARNAAPGPAAIAARPRAGGAGRGARPRARSPASRWCSLPGDEGGLLPQVVRFVGDRLALAAAEEPELARRAVDTVEVDLEPLPAVLDAEAAAGDDASVVARVSAEEGDAEAALAGALQVVEGEWTLPFTPAIPLEPPLAVTWLDEDRRLVVRTSAESPSACAAILADRLALPAARIRVVRPLVAGGSFGRTDLVAEDLCALVTLRTGRPARLVLSAEEELTTTPGRPAQRVRVRLGWCRGPPRRARPAAARRPRGRRRGRGDGAAALVRPARAGALPRPPPALRGGRRAHEPSAGERAAGGGRGGRVRPRVRRERGGRTGGRGRVGVPPAEPARARGARRVGAPRPRRASRAGRRAAVRRAAARRASGPPGRALGQRARPRRAGGSASRGGPRVSRDGRRRRPRCASSTTAPSPWPRALPPRPGRTRRPTPRRRPRSSGSPPRRVVCAATDTDSAPFESSDAAPAASSAGRAVEEAARQVRERIREAGALLLGVPAAGHRRGRPLTATASADPASEGRTRTAR